jgi:hypothetical protein
MCDTCVSRTQRESLFLIAEVALGSYSYSLRLVKRERRNE